MPDTPATYEDLIRDEATRQQVSPQFGLAIFHQEHAPGTNPLQTSPKGALGPMQLMPDTAKRYGVDPNDPVQNIRGGISHLKYLMGKYGNNLGLVAAAYNAGEGPVDDAKGVPNFPETQGYVKGVLNELDPPQQPGVSGKATRTNIIQSGRDLNGPPTPAFLGDPTKPASISSAEGIAGVGEVLRRSLPEVGGALGMALGSEAGPVGIGVGGYIGSWAGKGVQQVAQALGWGPPPPPTWPQQFAARNAAGMGGALNAAVGEGIGSVVPGGLLSVSPAIDAVVQANRQEGLGLSLPEILKGTKLGTALEGIQGLTERSTAGRLIATSARNKWAPAIRQAYAQGKVTLQDIGAAKGAIENTEDFVDNRPMKKAAQDLIDREIAPRAQYYGPQKPAASPATPGTTPAAPGAPGTPAPPEQPIKIGGKVYDINNLPPEVQARVRSAMPQAQTATATAPAPAPAPAAPPAPQSTTFVPSANPYSTPPPGSSATTRELYAVANSPDKVPFKAAVQQRQKFWDLSRTPIGNQATAEEGRALKMHGQFTQTLEDQNQQWGDLSHTYNELTQQITQPFVKKIIKQDPGAWKTALAQARNTKPYQEITSSQEGQEAIRRLQAIASAAARRDPKLPSRGWTPVLEGLALGTHPGYLAASEATSGLYTAAMYSPKIANYLIQGFNAPNAQLAGAAFTQAIDAWRAGVTPESRQVGAPPAPSTPPPAPSR